MKNRQEISEYEEEILQHLTVLQGTTMPKLSLMQQQPEINLKMRPLLLDFLMDVTHKLNLSLSTFPMTVNLIDRYCSTRIVKKQHYQLLGLTSLWISCKNHDSKFKIPSLFDLCKMCCNCYDRKLFLEMENHVLKSLDWNISFPAFDSYIGIFIDILQAKSMLDEAYKNEVRHLSMYICELVQFYPNLYFNYSSSQVALGALITSMLVCKVPINIGLALNCLNSYLTNETSIDLQTFAIFHQSLLKILKCPPPSLKMKYFNSAGNHISTIRAMINHVRDNLLETPITPKGQAQFHHQQGIPRTPCSNNISPKHNSDDAGSLSKNKNAHNLSISAPELLPSPKSSPNYVSSEIFATTAESKIVDPSTHFYGMNAVQIPIDVKASYDRKRLYDNVSESPKKKQKNRNTSLPIY